MLCVRDAAGGSGEEGQRGGGIQPPPFWESGEWGLMFQKCTWSVLRRSAESAVFLQEARHVVDEVLLVDQACALAVHFACDRCEGG